jgi:hypothetical protein
MTTTEPRHCDDCIHDRSMPLALRWWLFLHRLPAADQLLCREAKTWPALYATVATDRLLPGMVRGTTVRVVMASRMGDVGITPKLDAESGYTARVAVDDLENYRAERQP